MQSTTLPGLAMALAFVAGDEATPGGSGGYEADFIDDGTTPLHTASEAPLRCVLCAVVLPLDAAAQSPFTVARTCILTANMSVSGLITGSRSVCAARSRSCGMLSSLQH